MGGVIGQLIFIFILIVINSFFAASEISIVSLNNAKVKRQAEDGDKAAQYLVKLVEEPSQFLATIQVGITLAGFFASASAAVGISDSAAALMMRLGFPLGQEMAESIAFVLVTVLVAFFSLLLGELVPKRLAMYRYEEIARFVAAPLYYLSVCTSPVVKLLSNLTNWTLSAFGFKPGENDEKMTEEEIRLMVDVGEEKGVIQESERDMIDNIFEFDDTVVSEIMTPRTDIVGLELNSTLQEVLNIARNEKYTRLPIYDESIDNIVGILHTKDLLLELANHQTEWDGVDFKLSNIMRPVHYTPVYKKIDELFSEIKQNKNHMIVIIDEYGGTAGIVTVEDLLEEIVGNIMDEYDEEEESEIEKIDENTFIISGSVDIDQVNDELHIELPENTYETLGGFVLALLGKVPVEGEDASAEFGGMVFKIEEMEDKRIKRVKVYKSV